MAWYSDKFRRQLTDMHIDDWNDEFLSRFSPLEYAENLKTARVQYAMVYLQSHLGLCYWDTKSGKMHRHFIGKEKEIQTLIDLLHERDIKVIAYYSLNFNQWAHDNHPEWRMLQENGKSKRENDPTHRAGLCCPNNSQYREFVYTQIEEMLSGFSMDAMFFDMLYWPQVCYCDNCRRKYKTATGKEIPTSGATINEWAEFTKISSDWMGEWALSVTEKVKSIRPDMPVEHNYSAAVNPDPMVCCRDLINEASDYAGGDLYGGTYAQSFACKFYRTMSKNQPFEYMTGRCTPNLMNHTVTKERDELLQTVMITAAHHGANLLIDAIDPVGTLDKRVYELIGDIFSEEIPYEKYLYGEPIADIGIVYDENSKFNTQRRHGENASFLHFGSQSQQETNHTASVGAAEKLISANIPYDITTKNHYKTWQKYKVLIASKINMFEDSDVTRLIDYVENGGCLYFTGCEEKRLFETLIGGKCTGYTEVYNTYVYPRENSGILEKYSKKYPIPFNSVLPIVEGVDEDAVLAYIALPYTTRNEGKCASFHSDPPGIITNHPALVYKKYGKGKVVWCAGAPEYSKPSDYKEFLLKILSMLSDGYSAYSDAPKNVEILYYKNSDGITVNAVDLSDFDNLCNTSEFSVSVVCKSPKAVKVLPNGEDIPFEYDGEKVTFKVKDFKLFKMLKIFY